MNELICSIIHIYYGRIPLQPDFFLPLIKPVFQHQHVKPVNIRLAILILNMSASIKNKPNRHRLNYRHIQRLFPFLIFNVRKYRNFMLICLCVYDIFNICNDGSYSFK